MPTYLNNSLGGYSSTDPNCRQIYEHVQGCPVCQQIFRTGGNVNAVKQYHVMQQQRPPFVADGELPSFASAASSAIEISPTVAFLVVVLIVLLLVYIIRNMSRN